jgi:hypothetical protein
MKDNNEQVNIGKSMRKEIITISVVTFVLLCFSVQFPDRGVIYAQDDVSTGPMTLPALNKLLRQSVGRNMTEAVLAAQIERVGIAFDPTPEVISRLRAIGAHQHLINTIKREAEKLSASAKVVNLGTPPKDPFIEEVRKVVRDYVDELPDFICQQTIERYADLEARGAWDRGDTLAYELTYNRKRESYKPINTVGRPVTRSVDEVGGTISTGEFATRLAELFNVETKAKFKAAGKERLGNRQTLLYDFHVPKEFSKTNIKVDKLPATIAGYSGTVWIDEETKKVLRINQVFDDLPNNYPPVIFESLVDYDIVKLRGLDIDFLLPIKAEILFSDRMKKIYTRNLIYFKFYRKFETDIKIVEDSTPPPNQKP